MKVRIAIYLVLAVLSIGNGFIVGGIVRAEQTNEVVR